MTTLIIGDAGGGQVEGVADANLDQTAAAANAGTQTSIYFGTTASQSKRPIFKFSGFPSGAVYVSSAVLTLRNFDAAASSRGVELRQLLVPFVENEVTWNKRNVSTNWNVAGALGGTDVNATVLATGTAPTAASSQFTLSGEGFNALVQGWIDGSIINNGVILSCVNDASIFDNINRRIGTKDHPTPSNRPFLTVTYEAITPPSLTVSDPIVSNLSGTATFTITASSTFGTNIAVDYATVDVTATAGVDYVAKSGTATITAGQTTTTVVVDILP